ncbi:hypothetical protein Hypma_000285 [Hypsizygus marmoreus]|uniref:Uncharacterized protein n=1 Tax=Hypsizygus marmoreus TaxID=39966 RepID=A0A369JGK2_HYPMA|nr:hypothetical protein Hypma_000285 [Hypsizygus marmoreus]
MSAPAFNIPSPNITQLLVHDFSAKECTQFRWLQSETGMLISGSTAIEFFKSARYPDSDLDLFVQHEYAYAVIDWLQKSGYAFEPRASQIKNIAGALAQSLEEENPMSLLDYHNECIANIYMFFREHSRPIHLITSRHSAFEIILCFHSSECPFKLLTFNTPLTKHWVKACVMNFITHNNAYSLFLHATFVQYRSLSKPLSDEVEIAAKCKYELRGWTFEDPKDEYAVQSVPDLADCPRSVGDERMWTVALEPGLDLQRDDITDNTWYHTRTDSNELEMQYGRYNSSLLRYKYVRY